MDAAGKTHLEHGLSLMMGSPFCCLAALARAAKFGCHHQRWARSCVSILGSEHPREKLSLLLLQCSVVIRHQLGLVSGLQTVSSLGLSLEALSSVTSQH